MQNNMTMDALIIILGVIIAYFVFVALAVVLARIMFPKIDIDESELLEIGVLKMKKNAKGLKRKVVNQLNKKYSIESGKMPTGYTMQH